MKKIVLALLLPLLGITTFAQNTAEAEKWIDEGVAYHDKGDYEGALVRYDKALELDKDNLLALTEKAMTLLSLKRYKEAIALCKRAVELHPENPTLQTTFVVYGNALDCLKKTDESLRIYDIAIAQFPDYYQLHYNKGITLASVRKFDDAMPCFQKSVLLKPDHASSHNAIARIAHTQNKKIPAILAYSRFLSLEPQGDRAEENLQAMLNLMSANVEKTEDNKITINISPDFDPDDKKSVENSFGLVELILSTSVTLDYDEKNRNETSTERLFRRYETMFAALSETSDNNYGFFWSYYAPFFTDLKGKGHLQTFSYIANASTNDAAVLDWLKSHRTETNNFFDWARTFEWTKN